ncbi:pyruvate dehydrogenase [Janthinobacterium sp. NKUCC06_STL]|uniref:transketolase-like TK C-terminal-containing protein n=1 Tax=Janthinobacterium sp. NKUCC06_STL TaxID=2842127 RepID=UPI001C5A7481|nr:pyruvate dehydrogenase [Janthinobacterium sp. NKUCC06_STL]MBW3512381.1 pyruvate dehydrogenase [Janthinobacterium sp. NKUCC06_STL]
MHSSPSSPPLDAARDAAQACLAALAAPPALPLRQVSPRRALGAMARSLQMGPAAANAIRVVRAEVTQRHDDAWNVTASASAWPLRYGAEKPLLYLCRPASLQALSGVLVDARERGIVCSDAETQSSRWPKGVQPALPAWLAAQHNCMPFDPATGEEVRAILRAALETLYVEQQPGYYYLAIHDENADEDADEDADEYAVAAPLSAADTAAASLGMYRVSPPDPAPCRVRLCGAGRMLAVVAGAARLLQEDWDIAAQVWSCPSYTRLARDAQAAEQWNLRHPRAIPRLAHVRRCLDDSAAPVIAVTGYGQHIAGQIGGYVRGRFIAVGADAMMEVSAPWLAVTALKALADDGALPLQFVEYALRRYALL